MVTQGSFTMWGVVLAAAGCALVAACMTGRAEAFALSDGAIAQCIARGEVVPETTAAQDDPAMKNRSGWTRRAGAGWQITWNAARLKALPPEVRDFLFYHECAHARVPTEVELEANCAGLIDMRLAGRAGPAFENKLRSYFDARESYWADTFACADAWFAREREKSAPKAN
jgi:hypothetical protein